MAITKSFKKGDIICREGDYELWMYELCSGSVDIVKNYGEEEEKKISEISEGFFGEMGLIEALPRAATVVAKEDTVVELVDEETLSDYLTNNPEKFSILLLCLTQRLAKLNDSYREACLTVKEYLDAEQANRSIGTSLTAAMSKFARIFRMR